MVLLNVGPTTTGWVCAGSSAKLIAKSASRSWLTVGAAMLVSSALVGSTYEPATLKTTLNDCEAVVPSKAAGAMETLTAVEPPLAIGATVQEIAVPAPPACEHPAPPVSV